MLSLPTIAVLIDAENAQYCTIKKVLDELATFGNVVVKRAYGDFSNPRLNNWRHEMNRSAIQPVHGFSYVKEKNSSDILMVIDAMDLLHTQQIDIFCIVAGDSDYINLAQRIRRTDKRVIGVCKGSRSRGFVEACDRFMDTDLMEVRIREVHTPNESAVIERTATPEQSENPSQTDTNKHDLLKIIDTVFEQTTDTEDNTILLSQLTERIKQTKKNFTVKKYGFDTLSKVFKDDFFQQYYDLVMHSDRCTYSIKRIIL